MRDDLPASEIYNILVHLPADPDTRLGDYRLEIYEPDHSEIYCVVKVVGDYQPTHAEIAEQCGPKAVEMLISGEIYSVQGEVIEIEPERVYDCSPPELPSGPGLFHQPTAAADLATHQPYTWLAGQLIWWGYAEGNCPGGWSGVDVRTLTATPCGLAGAMQAVSAWQNQFDRDIYQAAKEANIPARLLKGLIGAESQFWPLWNSRPETSVAQITIDGLDIALRYDPALAERYCNKTLFDCARGYPLLRLAQQEAVRQALYADLTCYGCGPEEARQKTAAIIPLFARVLRAYYCYSVEISGETDPATAWQLAAAAYHAGGACITNGAACQRGAAYLTKIAVIMAPEDPNHAEI